MGKKPLYCKLTMTKKPIDYCKLNTCGFQFDYSYLELPTTLYTKIKPSNVKSPAMVILNDELAYSLGLDFSNLSTEEQSELFSGHTLPDGVKPFAQAYAGHQFGYFTILGDGRAHILGEHLLPDQPRVDIQFKGSGRTPYSRRGDGRATLSSMLREYLISEAMYGLHIQTTRSLAVVTTGEDLVRETLLPGAVLTRIAQSHIRVGTFEFAAANRDEDLLNVLLTYAAKRHFKELDVDDNLALAFLKKVMALQVDLIVNWMRVGFVHGVMNTDNMAISGETIDYGPCAFMDAYNPATVFSSIDHNGRYSFANQPSIAQWNLTRLAETLLPLIDQDQAKAIERAQETIGLFEGLYQTKWLDMMRSKLGLLESKPGDEQLIVNLLEWMSLNQADYTNTFRELSQLEKPSGKLYDCDDFGNWYKNWQDRLIENKHNKSAALKVMKQHNPAVIPRNHNVEAALKEAVKGDLSGFQNLLVALKNPYEDASNLKQYQVPPKSSDQVYQTFCGT
jgi:serine/tyrosine/threonine adenylyltransferase